MSIFSQLKSSYTRSAFLKDLIAAFSVIILLVPQGLAYGLLAGFPAEAGLYTGIVALFVYPLFASSRYLSVGPVALASIILLSGLSEFATPGTSDYIQLGLLVCLMAGIIQVIFGALRLGILVNFLSNPVISGFISATAIVIIVNQLNVLLGIPLERTNNALIDFKNTVINIANLHPVESIIGILSMITIFIFKAISKKIPSSLIVFIISSVAVYFLVQQGNEIARIASFPRGFPAPQFGNYSWDQVVMLLPLSLIIALMSFIDSSVLAKSMATISQDHRINSNKELYGLGLAKIVGSFFMNIPSSGSFARTEINRSSGSFSQMSSVFAGILMLILVLFCTPFFGFTPKAMLAAIIISSVIKLVNIKEMVRLFKMDKPDFFAMLACFLITIGIGIQAGIFTGILLSVGFILWKIMRPHYAVLGKLEEHDVYRNIDRYNDATFDKSILIFRFDDDLYFANSDYFFEKVLEEIEERKEMKTLILDFSSLSHIDSTGFDTLKLLSKSMKTHNFSWKFSGMKGPVRDLFDQYGYKGIIEKKDCYMSIDMAVESCE